LFQVFATGLATITQKVAVHTGSDDERQILFPADTDSGNFDASLLIA